MIPLPPGVPTEPPTPADVAIWESSFDRVTPLPGFLDDFYERLVAESAEIAALFSRTDFREQIRALAAALAMTGMLARGDGPAHRQLQRIAVAHDRDHLDVAPRHYGPWLDCLVAAAAAHDPLWSDEEARAWRRVGGVAVRLFVGAHPGVPDAEPIGGEDGWRRRHPGV